MKRCGSIDITAKIGQLGAPIPPEPEWPMYSYERPAYILWNAIADNLHRRGWSEARIKEWLQSKEPRWALDGSLGEAIVKLADKWAAEEI